MTKKAGVGGAGWSTSAAGWVDYDRDGTARSLCRGAMLNGTSRPAQFTVAILAPGYRAYCHPDNFKGRDEHPLSPTRLMDRLKMSARSQELKSRAARPWALPWPILITTDSWTSSSPTDSVRQSLYHNKGDGTFEDIAVSIRRRL